MTLLMLLACKADWSDAVEVLGPEVVLDVDSPEQVVPVSGHVVLEGPRNMVGELWVQVGIAWPEQAVVRAFWRGPELTPPPEEGTAEVWLGDLPTECWGEDRVLDCWIEAEVVFELLDGDAATLSPLMVVAATVDHPEDDLDDALLEGSWD